MLTKIDEGWWLDLSLITHFYINKHENKSRWSIKGDMRPFESDIEDGYKIEKALEKLYENKEIL